MYCRKCGAQVGDNDSFCGKCGYSLPRYEKPINQEPLYSSRPVSQGEAYSPTPTPRPTVSGAVEQESEYSDKNGIVVLILAIFAGGLGIHSFYAEKVGIGIAQLLTLGGCGIWVLVDIILLATGSFRDGNGKIIKLE